jgi:hypothetical protein
LLEDKAVQDWESGGYFAERKGADCILVAQFLSSPNRVEEAIRKGTFGGR